MLSNLKEVNVGVSASWIPWVIVVVLLRSNRLLNVIENVIWDGSEDLCLQWGGQVFLVGLSNVIDIAVFLSLKEKSELLLHPLS